jgi:hypothetical protein
MGSSLIAATYGDSVSANVNTVWCRAWIDAYFHTALLALGMACKIPTGTHEVCELG